MSWATIIEINKMSRGTTLTWLGGCLREVIDNFLKQKNTKQFPRQEVSCVKNQF